MGTVSGELSRRRTCPTKLEYPVAYLVLICCKRRPRRCSLLSLRLIAFLRCALSARGFHVGQPRLSGGYGHTWPCAPAGSGRASITVCRRVGVPERRAVHYKMRHTGGRSAIDPPARAPTLGRPRPRPPRWNIRCGRGPGRSAQVASLAGDGDGCSGIGEDHGNVMGAVSC